MDPNLPDPSAGFFIVFNDRSGRRDANDTRSALKEAFAHAGRSYRLFETSGGQPIDVLAREAVREAQAAGGVVVAAGGDGTINAVAQAVLGSGCKFGVLPQGTFNYFARTHGIPQDTEAALQVLLTGRAQPVQVGQVNQRVFLVNASLGLYPQLLQDREAYKKQFGRSRPVALLSALATLLHQPAQLRLRIERHEGGNDRVQNLRTPTLFVGNNRLQLEQTGIAEASVIEHGRLAAVMLKPVGTFALLGLLLRGALGRLGEADTVDSFASRRIVVRPWVPVGSRRVKVATDGEIVWMRPPLEFRVASERLQLIKPEEPVLEEAE